MKHFAHKVLSGAAPVVATTVSIAIVRAAELPFPAALSMQALPQWLLFCSVIYCSNALCLFAVDRVLGESRASVTSTPTSAN